MVLIWRGLWIACLIVGVVGCRTRHRVPDYLPREVIANQAGNAVVYQIDDPRNVDANVAAGAPSHVGGGTSGDSAGGRRGEPPRIGAVAPRKTLYGQPTGVTASDNGLREVIIRWDIPKDGVYRYRIERATSPEGPYVKVGEAVPRKMTIKDVGARDNPLKDSTAYYYRIAATIKRGGPESVPSIVAKAVTAPPPVAPATVSAVASCARGVTVTWAAVPSEGVSHYRVERAEASAPDAFTRVDVSRTCSLRDGGTAASVLKDSAKYRYRVIAVNRVNSESVPSGVAEVLTLPPPATVQKVTALSDEVRCVPVAWAPNGAADVVRYDVYRARQAEGPYEKIGSTQGRTTCSYLDGGTNPGNLEDEAIYYYKIRAVNAVTAESVFSEPIRALTRGVPAEVGGVVAVGGRPREIPIAWSMSQDRAVVGYEVWRADEGADNWAQVERINQRNVTNYLDRGGVKSAIGLGALADGSVYLYKVIGFNSANVRSSASDAAIARTKYRPAAPAGLTATTNMPLSISLAWRPNPEKDIREYVVECSYFPDESFRKLVVVPANRVGGLSATEMALGSGVVRYSRVKAVDQDGLESEWSKVVLGRAKPVPDAPANLGRESVGGNVRVSWRAPGQPDVQRYTVWRRKFVGWEAIATTDQTSYMFEFAEGAKPMTIAVSAVDKDGLDGEKSVPIEVKPGL